MTAPVKVRFAPSPTGLLHVGNCRTALINWLFARHQGGIFLLRIDDTDQERSKAAYEEAIKKDLAWLGMTYDVEERQSSRLARYEEQAAYLKQIGRLYPCYETPEELQFKRKQALGQGRPPLYDRAALRLTNAQKQAYEAEGRQPHWRFQLTDTPIHWHDLVRGDVSYHGSHLSDPVLIREDNTPIYTLASVVDDVDMDITHIVRGEDHVSNTAIQLQLIEALGGNPQSITFAHLPLLVDATGEGLSKRLGSMSLGELREENIHPLVLMSILAKIGTSDPIDIASSVKNLIEGFSFDKFSRATPKFSLEELRALNQKFLHRMDFAQAKESFPLITELHIDQVFWEAVRDNLETIHNLTFWHQVYKGEISPTLSEDDKQFLKKALALLPLAPWTDATWHQWVAAIKTQTDRKGKGLFMPIRQALTGEEHGPELGVLFTLLGHKKVRQRLTEATV